MARLMAELNLFGVVRGKTPRTTFPAATAARPADLGRAAGEIDPLALKGPVVGHRRIAQTRGGSEDPAVGMRLNRHQPAGVGSRV